jgi:transcriptional regulator with XRE-family HTH domain
MTKFGENIKSLLKSKNLKSIDLAEKMGVSHAYISQLITGNRRPGRETLLKLSKSLDIPVETLIKLESDNLEDILSSKKIPVYAVHCTNVNHSSMTTNSFEFATTNDPDAFYLNLKSLRSSNGLGAFDLMLIEPNVHIENGNTVLACSSEEFSIRKISIKNGIIVLSNEMQEPIIYLKENGDTEIRLFRATQCIKKL